jgi:16S rRNA (cytosine967-C5)-methyltransferase
LSAPSPPRLAAYHALLAVERDRLDLPSALVRARSALNDERDRALASEIAVGTLRWQAQLDFLIAFFGRRPVSRLDPEVLTILRLSAYQLLHLTRIPAAAATNEAVTLTRSVRKASAAGFVNAVLRSIWRAHGALPLPRRPTAKAVARISEDPAAHQAALDYLSVTLSHPRWLAARWLGRHGFDATVRWAEFNNAAAPLTLRVNTLKTTPADLARQLREHGVVTTAASYAPDGLLVRDGNPLRTPLGDRGAFLVQDEASQLVGLLTAAQPGERVLDCCASPGGKTTSMAAAMRDEGFIVAADVRPRRVELLRRAVERSGARSVRIIRLDAEQPLPFHGTPFDLVLIDAPCSGLGTIRRDPEIRWRRQESDLARFAAAQLLMLENASQVVRPGGRIVYATCSSEPDENEAVVSAFLAGHRRFTLVDVRAEAAQGLAAVLDDKGMLRTSPVAHGLEAFFGVVLKNSDK